MARPQEICIFAPNLYLSVTVEPGTEQGYDDLHIHPGGQGFWVARLLRRLGEQPMLVGVLGGEIGRVLSGLLPEWGVNLAPVQAQGNSGGAVFDRRSGVRRELARAASARLGRHEVDELYGITLERASEASVCVITGRAGEEQLPVGMYRRLAADLHATGVPAIADLHGAELDAYLEGGSLAILKVSDEELSGDGLLSGAASLGERVEVARRLQQRGALSVVVSSGDGPTVGVYEDEELVARAPRLQAVDHRGSGDSMTAGLAAGYRRRLGPVDGLRLACAAGAANVTRHGLATASRALIEQLADQVEIEPAERSEARGESG